MNPLKADKVQLGFTDNSPHITRGAGSSLSLYDPNIGSVLLSTLITERGLDNFATVSKSLLGSDYSTIQSAVDSLPTEGGTVIVYGGTYAEQITISKPVVFISRGAVNIESTDTSCISISSASVVLDGFNFVVKSQLGNTNPSAIEITSDGLASYPTTLKGCVLDISGHANAEFITSSQAEVIVSDTLFTGIGKISISSTTRFLLNGCSVCPEVELTNLISTSYISANQTVGITLVGSEVSVEGRLAVYAGDNASALTKSQIVGGRDFQAEDVVDITFNCPLSTDQYMVLFEDNSQREIPVISNRTTTGFRVSFSNPLNETVRWSILM